VKSGSRKYTIWVVHQWGKLPQISKHTLNITVNGSVLGMCCSIQEHRLHLRRPNRRKVNPGKT